MRPGSKLMVVEDEEEDEEDEEEEEEEEEEELWLRTSLMVPKRLRDVLSIDFLLNY